MWVSSRTGIKTEATWHRFCALTHGTVWPFVSLLDWFSCVTRKLVQPCDSAGILNTRYHKTEMPSDCLRLVEIWDGDLYWHFKCITTGFRDYWVSFYFPVVVSSGKIIWLFSRFLIYKRQLASAQSLLYDDVKNNYTLCAWFWRAPC